MFSARALQMSASMLRAQAPVSTARSAQKAFQQTRGLRLQATPKRMAAPKEEHSAHTISQRIRTLRKIPPELLPIGAVLLVAISFAAYSLGKKLFTDSTLRLHRSSRQH